MTDLLTSPIGGAIVLALLLLVLVRTALREASGDRPVGSRLLLVSLLALFLAQVVARFVRA